MPHPELQQVIDWTVVSLKSGGQLSDDSLQALRVLLPDSIIIAAFDLIDRGKVYKYSTSWDRTFFEVFGSKGRYKVSVDLPSPTPSYCPCPAFAYNILLLGNQVMCKHVLAVQLARTLGKCIERSITEDELITIVCPDVMLEAEQSGQADESQLDRADPLA